MSRRRRPFDALPRILSAKEAANYIGKSRSWFDGHLDELQKSGFPVPLSVLGGYDREAIDAWLDRLGGGERRSLDFDAALTAAAHG